MQSKIITPEELATAAADIAMRIDPNEFLGNAMTSGDDLLPFLQRELQERAVVLGDGGLAAMIYHLIDVWNQSVSGQLQGQS